MPSFEVREIRKNNVSRSYVGQTLDSRVVGQSLIGLSSLIDPAYLVPACGEGLVIVMSIEHHIPVQELIAF